jgi:glycosyltransferase involved in cell wall biosynthesis
MNHAPEVSIIMPVFNSENFIQAAVESLLTQTFHDFELIIVNDGSTDNSLNIIRSFSDNRIRILNNDRNRGIVYSRNRGLKEARGKFIAPFDSDDIALPEKFEKQITFLHKNPDFGMIGSWAKLIDQEGSIKNKRWKLPASPQAIPSILLFRNYFAQPSLLIRRELIPQGGYEEGYEIGEDYIMWADIAKKAKVWNLPEHLVYIRQHPGNMSRKDNPALRDYESRIYQRLFKPLKIEVDSTRFELLMHLKYSQKIENPDILKSVEGFLTLILSQNLKLKVYAHKYLVRTVFNRWLKACYMSKEMHLKSFFSFIKSPLLGSSIRYGL